MKVNVLSIKGKIVEELDLQDSVFSVKPNKEVLTQYLRIFSINQRQGNSSTKTRGEVSGGGKKPWKQKGTGRARQGSTRGPHWRHGGVAHGPKPKDWFLKFPKKMRRLAFLSALALKPFYVVESIKLDKPKTAEIQTVLINLKLAGKTLLVLDKNNNSVVLGARNIANLDTAFYGTLNPFQLMNAKNVVFVKDALLNLQGKYETK